MIEKETFPLIALVAGIVIIAILVVGIGLRDGNSSTLQDVITVQGQATMDTAPDQAEILLRVQTRGESVLELQNTNRQIMNGVYETLGVLGIDKKSIETSSYNLYPVQEWERDKIVNRGHQLDHVIKVTVTDLDTTGKVIDAAVQAGVNNVDGVSFSLSRQKEKEAYAEVLASAAAQAKAKAATIADGLDITLGEPIIVSESAGFQPPVMYKRVDMMAEAAPEPTPISPSDVAVSAVLTVSYEIE